MEKFIEILESSDIEEIEKYTEEMEKSNEMGVVNFFDDLNEKIGRKENLEEVKELVAILENVSGDEYDEMKEIIFSPHFLLILKGLSVVSEKDSGISEELKNRIIGIIPEIVYYLKGEKELDFDMYEKIVRLTLINMIKCQIEIRDKMEKMGDSLDKLESLMKTNF